MSAPSAVAQKSDVRRQSVINTAIDLYFRHGFAATTMDMIAQASGVARRTIFRDFPTKEDIVLAWTVTTGPALVGCLDPARSKEDPVDAATRAVLSHIDAQRDFHPISLSVSRLIEDTPSLKARAHEKYQIWEDMMAAAIVSYGGDPLAASMATAIAIGGLRIASRQWTLEGGARSMLDLTMATYASLPRLIDTKDQA
jgi:AcrR family transcriptional regulator